MRSAIVIFRALGGAVLVLLAACATPQTVPPASPAEKPTAATSGAIPPAAVQVPPAPAAPPAPPIQPLTEEEGTIAEGELCLSCHSAELIQYSRIGEAGWKAELVKMRNWGALVEEDKVASFAAWFARHYPADQPPPPPRVNTAAEAIAAVAPEPGARAIHGDREAGAAAYAKDCASCHGASAEGTGGGPVLIEAPVLYQPRRFAALTKTGQGRMPAFPTLSKTDANNLLEYLRSLR